MGNKPSPMRSFLARERRAMRAELIQKYGPYCQLCLIDGRDKNAALIDLVILNAPVSWSVDHIVPMSRGGKNELSNMWPSHKGCNTERGNTYVKEVHCSAI